VGDPARLRREPELLPACDSLRYNFKIEMADNNLHNSNDSEVPVLSYGASLKRADSGVKTMVHAVIGT